MQDTISQQQKACSTTPKDLEGVIRREYIDRHDALKKDVEVQGSGCGDISKDKLVEEENAKEGERCEGCCNPCAYMEPAAAKDLSIQGSRGFAREHDLCGRFTVYNDKPMLSVMFSDDMVKDHGLNAGKMIREAAKLIRAAVAVSLTMQRLAVRTRTAERCSR